MSDIVERLRARAFRIASGQAAEMISDGDWARLCVGAADEIERLRNTRTPTIADELAESLRDAVDRLDECFASTVHATRDDRAALKDARATLSRYDALKKEDGNG